MKKIFALLLALCLLPVMAIAAEVDISAMAGSQTFGDPEVTITGTAGSPLSLIFQDTVETVILKDVQFTAPADQYALLFKHSADESVKVIFKGTNAVTGGDDAIYSEGSVAVEPVDSAPSHTLTLTGGSHADKTGGSGIWAHDVSIAGYVTAVGGNSINASGGGGIDAYDVSITGHVTAIGGNSTKENGGMGIDAIGDINISGVVMKAVGGNGAINGRQGISAADGDIVISGTVEYAAGGRGTTGRGGNAMQMGHGNLLITETGAVKLAVGGDGGHGANGTNGAVGDAVYCSQGDITIHGSLTAVGGNTVNEKGGHGVYAKAGSIDISGDVTATGGNSEKSDGGAGVYAARDIDISGDVTATGGYGEERDGGAGVYTEVGSVNISGMVTAAGGNSEEGCGGRGICAAYDIDISGTVKSAIGGNGAQGGGWGLRAGNINISGTVLKAIGGNSTNGTGGIALNAGKSINICGMVKSAVGGSSGRAGNSGISAQEGDIVISGVVESTVGGDAVEMRAGDGIQLGYGNLLITETGVVESAVGGDCVNGYNNRAGNGVFCSKGDATISGSLKAVGGNTVNIKGGDGITAKNITIGISGNVNAAGGNSEKSSAGFGASATENVEISGRLFAMSGIGGKGVKDVVAVSSKKLLLNDVSASESMDGRWWEKTRSSNMRFFSAPEMINPPLTGDDSQFGLWVLLMGMAGAAMLMLRKRARN